MSFKVKTTSDFDRSVKQIAKKYKSFKQDLTFLIQELEQTPEMGVSLGNNLFKIRMPVTGSNKGKSGGARVITYVKVTNETVMLAQIYLKTDYDTVDEKAVLKRLSDEGLI
jgi:hypothetical protein